MMDEVARQKLEELDGSRRLGNRDRAAVRLGDLNGLLALPDAPKSEKVVSSVTAADFNALVEDVHTIHTRLRAVIVALRGRRGR
ncbi:MAG: hypothetical protein GEU95_01290 [Rhizobiales bacterium]|nr:hypothetical protein [Hyphomicrobiales bacterium]